MVKASLNACPSAVHLRLGLRLGYFPDPNVASIQKQKQNCF